MGMEKIGKGVGKLARGVALAGAMLTPEGAQASEATLREQFLAQKALVTAQFNAEIKKEKNPNKQAELKNKLTIALAQVDVELAQALHVADEAKNPNNIVAPHTKTAGDQDFFSGIDTKKTVAYKKETIDDGKGNITETFQATKSGAGLVKHGIDENADVKKAEANANRPQIIVDNYGYGGRYYGGGWRSGPSFVGGYPGGVRGRGHPGNVRHGGGHGVNTGPARVDGYKQPDRRQNPSNRGNQGKRGGR